MEMSLYGAVAQLTHHLVKERLISRLRSPDPVKAGVCSASSAQAEALCSRLSEHVPQNSLNSRTSAPLLRINSALQSRRTHSARKLGRLVLVGVLQTTSSSTHIREHTRARRERTLARWRQAPGCPGKRNEEGREGTGDAPMWASASSSLCVAAGVGVTVNYKAARAM
ncbi:hypothetical protein DFH06DRAFT_1195753 [Mycena polygramma]|nr:hypothetical protein DFH06DRAFT_1195753 [Mycena polygramma]